jgi:glycolate oxidase
MGGTVTGEHGVGESSTPCVQFSAAENEQMFGVKRRLTARPSEPGQGHPDLNRAEYGKCWCAAENRTQTCPGF